jgi:superfamily II DNA or RNA helicase
LVNDFKDYGWYDVEEHVGVLNGESKPDFSKKILISTYHSVTKRPQSFFEPYKAMIVDEAQVQANNSMMTISKKCVNTKYVVGFSGTLPSELICYKRIIGALGPVITRVTTKELQDRGIVSDLKIKGILLKYNTEFISNNKNREYHDEIKEIISYKNRNKVLKYIIDSVKLTDNTLILVQYIEHIKAIKEYLEEVYGKTHSIRVIYGKTKVEEREEIRLGIDDSESTILLATYSTVGAGFSTKNLKNLIFGSSYKKEIKVLQAIGRSLRKFLTKDYAQLFDICDDWRYITPKGNVIENTVYKHFVTRLGYYNEQSFKYVIEKVYIDSL